MAARLSRQLLGELISFLGQRQAATAAQVAQHARAADARESNLALRRARIDQRLDRIESAVERYARQVREIQVITRGLRTARPPAARPRLPTPSATAPNGHVQPFQPGKVLLRVENLAKEIGGTDILTDINFEIFEHEILGLIGPNGAGKTTLMECLANLRPRTAGTFYEGEEAPADWDPSRLMFYLPNGVAPYAELYTIEVLTLFGRLFEVEPRRWQRIIVDELSLGPALQKRVSALSKGNLQRLLIALALMSPQPLLALDEPFDGLDVHQTHAMMGILRNLRAQGRTLLLCIHQLSDAERVCDRLLLLAGGRTVGLGTLTELREQAGLSQGSLEDIFLSLTGHPAEARASAVGTPTASI
ncbi:MAG TPA: ABC transporter ATP-binding protein [Chloroflexota bacterium]